MGHRHIIGTIIYCVTDYDQNDNDGLNDYVKGEISWVSSS